MSERRDLVHGWLRKAISDLAAIELALGAGTALDAACFHAQQAAEKALKAYLIAYNTIFPLRTTFRGYSCFVRRAIPRFHRLNRSRRCSHRMPLNCAMTTHSGHRPRSRARPGTPP
ncbi:MAG TPA: HEPN domain-containing protein [Thermomicrobiales bacterium]|nr:HEPN domain-containing protein [Thermomicrobiales bacterium]